VILPVSDEKMKLAGPFFPPDLTTNDFVSLKTAPAGAPPGIVTVRGAFFTGLPAVPPV